VFDRVRAVVDRFIDFNRSFASQQDLCELTACYVLGTYLLDAFNVAGYLWPNGESGAGKTTYLQVLAELGYLGLLILSGGTYASLRDLADYGALLCFDDAENVTDPRRLDPDKRTLLLAGNRRGSTVTVKEPTGEKTWAIRHVSAFCPRAFSAIRLPDPVLGSRTVIVPLVRSGDPGRAKADPADHASWPHDRRRLLDDLWALGLANLPALPAYDKQAAEQAELMGRDLEPWRVVLAVALWLEEQHQKEGLYTRMHKLMKDYQQERGDLEPPNAARPLLQGLFRLLDANQGKDDLTFTPGDLAAHMNALAIEEGLCNPGEEFTNPRKVGWALKRLRFKKSDTRNRKSKTWKTTRGEVEDLARAHRVEPAEDGPAGREDDRDTF
jgi:hypothetical protein